MWYRGESFHGFQRQPGHPTVQLAMEQALAHTGRSVTVMPAGRTDRGVHARMQVLSLRLPLEDSVEEVAQALTQALPPSVGICFAGRPSQPFHAQWSAVGKAYRYRLQLEGRPSDAWDPYAMNCQAEERLEGRVVSAKALADCLHACLGARDFSAFHERSSPQKLRRLTRAELLPLGGGLYEVQLEGDGFARYQVRYLVGSALLCAAGLLPREAFEAALNHSQPVAGLKAPAKGLILWEVFYPPACDPFSEALRAAPPGLPSGPPFETHRH